MSLKNNKTRCGKCRCRSFPGIPLEKCHECKNRFCPDDFWRGMYHKDRMSENDELRVLCDSCKDRLGYIPI